MKNRILEKAADLFLNLGVKSVTMDEIAAELGVSKKTIYAHYATKEKLVKATSLFVFDTISKGIDEIQEENKNPIEELFIVKGFALENLKDEKSAPYYQLQKYYPEIASVVTAKQQELMENCLTDNLKRGIEQGLYRAEIPIDFISKIYFIGILGIRDPEVFPETNFPTSALVEQHLEYHLRAIVTQKGLETLLTYIAK